MSNKLNRRDFLRLGGLAAAGVTLAACTPTPAPEETEAPPPGATDEPQPTEAPPETVVEGNVVVMHRRSELTEDEQAQFEADNPGITIEFYEESGDRLAAMLAAGNAPDLWRAVPGQLPGYLIHHVVLDLTPYFEVSDVLAIDDLAPANSYWMAEDIFNQGSGKNWGMVKDWGPRLTLFINTELFEQAGVEVPADDTVLTYAELEAMAEQLTVHEGDRTLVWGFGGEPIDWSLMETMWVHIAETEGEYPGPYTDVLFNDIYTDINLVENEKAIAALQYYYGLAERRITSSPLDPTPGWNGGDFTEGKIAIIQEGYWFGGMAESDFTRGKVKMLPSPRWAPDGHRLDNSTATGAVMYGKGQNPDAAWRVFEWYNGEEPAVARAMSGWGVPGLISLYDLLPQESEFDLQRYNTLMWEMENVDCETAQPVPVWGAPWFNTVWNKHIEPVLYGDDTFENALTAAEAEMDQALMENFEQAAG